MSFSLCLLTNEYFPPSRAAQAHRQRPHIVTITSLRTSSLAPAATPPILYSPPIWDSYLLLGPPSSVPTLSSFDHCAPTLRHIPPFPPRLACLILPFAPWSLPRKPASPGFGAAILVRPKKKRGLSRARFRRNKSGQRLPSPPPPPPPPLSLPPFISLPLLVIYRLPSAHPRPAIASHLSPVPSSRARPIDNSHSSHPAYSLRQLAASSSHHGHLSRPHYHTPLTPTLSRQRPPRQP